MDPQTTAIITAIIGAAGGILVKHFLDSFNEWRRGRKDEADRLADKADRWKSRARQWEFAYYETARLAIKQGASQEDLPQTPDQ